MYLACHVYNAIMTYDKAKEKTGFVRCRRIFRKGGIVSFFCSINVVDAVRAEAPPRLRWLWTPRLRRGIVGCLDDG